MSVDASEVATQVHRFLIEEIFEDEDTIAFNCNLLTEVGVDSMGMLRLVGFLESTYELTISPIYFTIENFQHIDAISQFIVTLIEKEKG